MRSVKIIIFGLALMFFVYQIGSAIYYLQVDGRLYVQSADSSSRLVLLQPGHQPVLIGYGSVKIRLHPGNYEIVASANNQQVSASFQIKTRQLTYQKLDTPTLSTTSKIDKTNALIKLLPYTDKFARFRLSYVYQTTSSIATPTVIVTSQNAKGRQAANDWLLSLGYDPSDLILQYVTGSPLKP